jgi:LmbE family N-acetylglucosaminyl deacetylase
MGRRSGQHEAVPFTVVSFHAHPDDDALLTAGTLARAAAEGHRVVLVTATDGAAGLASRTHTGDGNLGRHRMEELHRAAAALGCQDVHLLGFADSGLAPPGADPPPGPAPGSFGAADVEEAATRLAAILAEAEADVLTVYDPAGGYGHPDHVQVHRVGIRAAELAGTAVVLEATVDRRPLVRVLTVLQWSRVLHLLGVDQREWNPARFERAYSDPALITHRVGIRDYAAVKRAVMAAHASQASADAGVRTLSVFLRLPPWTFARVFSHEWFVERGRAVPDRPLDDIFASLRPAASDLVPPGADPGRAGRSSSDSNHALKRRV